MSDGGPAFPVPGFKDNEEFNGMTLRDYFAAKAMGSLLSLNNYSGSQDDYAKMAYSMSDAMLAARGGK